MKATIKQGKSTLMSVSLKRGWNKLNEYNGIEVLANGDAVYFNCGGTLFFDQIILEDILSRITFRLLGNRKVYGTSNECAPPLQAFIMRMASLPSRAPSSFKYGDVQIPFGPTLAHASPQTFVPSHLGMYAVTGELQADTPGGAGIEPVNGWEQDVPWLIARSDAIIHRTSLAWLDMNTGEPKRTLAQPIYNGSRGWAKTTQIQEVCDLYDPSNIYDDRRKPKMANQGTCAYFADLAGLDRYNSHIAPDWQHFVRSLGPVLAAAACGDLVAKMFLKIFATNAKYCHPLAPVLAASEVGHGSSYYGSRECAWVTSAFLSTPEYEALGKQHLDKMVQVQMPNGCFHKIPTTAPWSPPPTGAPEWMWQQSMEMWLCCHALALDGRVEPIRKALSAVFDSPWMDQMGYVPKFLRTSTGGSQIEPTITQTSLGADYFPWVALGAYACLAPLDPKWKQWVLKIATPSQGKATSLADLKTRLRKEVSVGLGKGQVIAMLSALERVA